MGNISWQEALTRLKKGNENFVKDKLDGKLQNSSRREELITEQNPYAVILGCSDSRVVPEIIFDTGLGDLFVIRVAGNIANFSSIASIEYAITNLNVKLIIILGHESCGAITAAIGDIDHKSNFKYLYDHIKPAIDLVENKSVNEIAKKNAELTKINLIRCSKSISNYIGNKNLKILSAFYSLKSGKVDFNE